MQPSTAAIERMRQDPEGTRQGLEFIENILSRSATEPEFRQQLLNDPKTTVISSYNESHDDAIGAKEIPWDIRFIEPVGDVTYVLPKVADGNAELADDELDAVAGGALPLLVWALFGGASALGVGVICDRLGL